MTELLTTEETYLNHLLTVKNVKEKKKYNLCMYINSSK